MNSQLHIKTHVVSVEWLHKNLYANNLIVLDGTINKVFDASSKQIPNTRLFDIKNKFSNTTDPFPSAFPLAEQFQKSARELGINNDSALVVYDDKGIYSSARVWWLFKAFGFNNVAVLNGGFPAWLKADYPTEPMLVYKGDKGDFTANLQPKTMAFFEDVKAASKHKTHTIVDARSSGRFQCKEPEPRKGLRMGTIPNSVNLPFSKLLENGSIKPKEDLDKYFSALIKNDNAIIFSCGSGITACVLVLGATISGYENIAVYDGSWTEWGSLIPE